MRKELMNDLLQAGLMTAVIAVALPDMSWAQDLNTTVSTVKSGISGMPNIVSGIAYIAGFVLMGSGALKLKAHAENPAQEKMAPGIARLATGAGLAALPALSGWVIASTKLNGTTPIAYGGGLPDIP